MRKYNLSVGAVLLAFILGPPKPLMADTIVLTINSAGSHAMGGVYVGPYNFTIGSTSVGLICDDFKDNVIPVESWQANTSTFPSLSNVKFTGANETQNYEEAGWLVQQMQMYLPGTGSSNAQTVGDIQWAIWDIFYPGVSTSDPYGSIGTSDQTNIATWLTNANLNYASGNYSNVMVYTPVPGTQVPVKDGPPQELLGVMPEPMTLWSLLIVLAAIALAHKWVDRTNVESPASAQM